MVSALLFGRMDTRGREWRLLVCRCSGSRRSSRCCSCRLPPKASIRRSGSCSSPSWAIGGGILNGPIDIALFTIRQRRTDPAWTGRAFAVSMAMNFVGFPIGALLAGALAEQSLAAAIVPAVAFCLLAVVFAATMIPREDPADAGHEPRRPP